MALYLHGGKPAWPCPHMALSSHGLVSPFYILLATSFFFNQELWHNPGVMTQQWCYCPQAWLVVIKAAQSLLCYVVGFYLVVWWMKWMNSSVHQPYLHSRWPHHICTRQGYTIPMGNGNDLDDILHHTQSTHQIISLYGKIASKRTLRVAISI